MAEFHVAELFTSINGEGIKAGQLAVFVRFAGCNLNCTYCDTAWANQKDTKYNVMSEQEILNEIQKTGITNITLTGGEPLLREHMEILFETLLSVPELLIEVETNGSVALEKFQNLAKEKKALERLSFTMDYKLPQSQMESAMCLENIKVLQTKDTIKFVCSNRKDLERAEQIVKEYQLIGQCHVYFSPVFGKIDPAEMVLFMKERKLNGVNLQLQLHKFIWNPEQRGV